MAPASAQVVKAFNTTVLEAGPGPATRRLHRRRRWARQGASPSRHRMLAVSSCGTSAACTWRTGSKEQAWSPWVSPATASGTSTSHSESQAPPDPPSIIVDRSTKGTCNGKYRCRWTMVCPERILAVKLGFALPIVGPAITSATGLSAFCSGPRRPWLRHTGSAIGWSLRLMHSTYPGKEQPHPPQMTRYLDPASLWTGRVGDDPGAVEREHAQHLLLRSLVRPLPDC